MEVPRGADLPDGVAAGAATAAAKTLAALAGSDRLRSLDDETRTGLLRELRAFDRTESEVLWTGGGGFRVLDVGPSMFEEVGGRVYLAEWATNGALGEAVAAQFGYEYEPDEPFSGRKGKTRLAVIDGLVNDGVVRILVDQLAPDEKVTICGTAIDPDCRAVLRALRRGSTLKKVPSSILDDYRIRRRDRIAMASSLDWSAVAEIAAGAVAETTP